MCATAEIINSIKQTFLNNFQYVHLIRFIICSLKKKCVMVIQYLSKKNFILN